MAGQKNDYEKRSSYQPEFPGSEGGRRTNPTEEKESHGIGPDDTVYRYLCPGRKVGSIIGRGGDIIKQLRADTQAKIRINESVPGCEERVVIIYSSSEETNSFGNSDDFVCPALDALFKVHDKIIAEDAPVADDEFGEAQQITVRMLVPSDQIGCVLGKGGEVVKNIRSETRAQIRILSDDRLPYCASNFDELLQVSGDTTVVKDALYRLATRLHENPSRSQHQLLSSSSIHRAGGGYMGPMHGAPMGPHSVMGPYGSYKNDGGDWAASAKEFSLRFVCPTENIGAVIGKGGVIIKQIRQESGAAVKVDSDTAEGDDCLITVSAKEVFEEPSPTIDAAMRLQPRCSEKSEKDSGVVVLITRLLVPSSRIGCLIGKGGAIISEMRSLTRANIRIISMENLPRVASEDEEMVQITGDMNVASNALLEVTTRLRANVFEMGGTRAGPPAMPYHPMPMDTPDASSRYRNRDGNSRGRGRGRGHSSRSDRYDQELPQGDDYGGYGGSQISGSGYGGHGVYSGGPSSGSYEP